MNRTLTNTIERKTPYEIFFKKKPSVKNLKIYGSIFFFRIPEEQRRSKWDKKAEIGILLVVVLSILILHYNMYYFAL